MNSFVVAFYEIDRAYGGPEEGGWWYDCGTLIRVFAVRKSREEATKVANRAQSLLDRLQRNKRQVGSVIYSGGRHMAMVCKNTAAPHFPEETPRYE